MDSVALAFIILFPLAFVGFCCLWCFCFCNISKANKTAKTGKLKFIFSKKATKIEEIFTVDLTLTT